MTRDPRFQELDRLIREGPAEEPEKYRFELFSPPSRCGTAEFSPCRHYRYDLRRYWNVNGKPLRMLHFVMLNPSTADEKTGDATVERCWRRANMLGFNGLAVSNIFAWRSTSPFALYDLEDPVGDLNDEWIRSSAKDSEMTICAWGGHGKLRDRGKTVSQMLRGIGKELHYLRLSQITGEPAHPLYISYSQQPVLWKLPDVTELS